MFDNFRLKRVTYNLGNVVETKTDITCAVNNNKLKNRLIKHDNCLLLKSKNDPKPITYVISDMIFPPHLKITTEDNKVFLNCTFIDELTINMANSITFTNNDYLIGNNNFKYNDRFLVINNTNKVNFIDENFVNHAILSYPYDMKITANNIRIERSNLYNNNSGHVNFNCKNLRIKDKSNLSLRSGYIKTKDILIDYTSNIRSNKRLIIDNPKDEFIGLNKIDCPRLILNNIIRDNPIDINNSKVKTKRI